MEILNIHMGVALHLSVVGAQPEMEFAKKVLEAIGK
jgi:hypothetical protein